jgi:Flp pilus assembly protein TadB
MMSVAGSPWSVDLVGVAVGLAVVGLASGLRSRSGGNLSSRPIDVDDVDGTDVAASTARSTFGARSFDRPALALAATAGVVCVVVTGWPMAGPIGGLAVYGLPRLLKQTSGSVSITKIEAIATWTEMLQGTLAASAGLSQAIMATADLSPEPIRPATLQLAAQIRSGVHPQEALFQFADAVGDPCADRVVCSLLLAFTSRAQRLGELLQALAESTREEVALRLRIETSRASVRSGVRTVVVFSVAFAALLSIVARSYLAPFGSATGQLVLAAVGALYAGGLTLMVALARPPAPVRLLGSEVEQQ